jgi:DNA polymerase I-like protein with 3'-5' exonuclease and polymerase domains
MGLARRINGTLREGEKLLKHHHRVFSRFWEWSDNVSDYAQLNGELVARLGWRMQLSPTTSIRTMRNFPMQAGGSEMLRLACVYVRDANVNIIATIHDAIFIEAAEADIEQAVKLAQDAMERASKIILSGFALKTEVRIVRSGERLEPLSEKDGKKMWEWLADSLAELESSAQDAKVN